MNILNLMNPWLAHDCQTKQSLYTFPYEYIILFLCLGGVVEFSDLAAVCPCSFPNCWKVLTGAQVIYYVLNFSVKKYFTLYFMFSS